MKVEPITISVVYSCILLHILAYSSFFFLQYPEPQFVDLYGIDEHFRASRAHLRRAVDLREDYVYGLAHFKESVGRGPQALLGNCVEVVATRAKGSGLALFLNVVGEVCVCVCVCVEGRG